MIRTAIITGVPEAASEAAQEAVIVVAREAMEAAQEEEATAVAHAEEAIAAAHVEEAIAAAVHAEEDTAAAHVEEAVVFPEEEDNNQSKSPSSTQLRLLL